MVNSNQKSLLISRLSGSKGLAFIRQSCFIRQKYNNYYYFHYKYLLLLYIFHFFLHYILNRIRIT